MSSKLNSDEEQERLTNLWIPKESIMDNRILSAKEWRDLNYTNYDWVYSEPLELMQEYGKYCFVEGVKDALKLAAEKAKTTYFSKFSRGTAVVDKSSILNLKDSPELKID